MNIHDRRDIMNIRYTRSVKYILVHDVHLGIQKREDVLRKHLLSDDEFKKWEAEYAAFMPQKLLPFGELK